MVDLMSEYRWAGSAAVSQVADCLKQLGLSHCVSRGRPEHHGSDTRFSGRARTLRFLPKRSSDVSTGVAVSQVEVIADMAEHDVVVIETGDATCSFVGGNIVSAAARQGVTGIIVDGCVRDLDDLARSHVPVVAAGASPESYHGHYELVEVGGPVRCFGAVISEGDVVCCDEDGFVVVPSSLCDAVEAKLETVLDDERWMAESISAGVPAAKLVAELNSRRGIRD
jgi:regulator of RNase E activity RraA